MDRGTKVDIIRAKIPTFGDERGQLTVMELFGGKTQSRPEFELKRLYYLHHITPGATRGGHAHRVVEQLFFCINGGCKCSLDNGRIKYKVTLDTPDNGLYVGPMIWHEMSDFKPHTVLLVLASGHHDEAEYIRDYEEFMEVIDEKESRSGGDGILGTEGGKVLQRA